MCVCTPHHVIASFVCTAFQLTRSGKTSKKTKGATDAMASSGSDVYIREKDVKTTETWERTTKGSTGDEVTTTLGSETSHTKSKGGNEEKKKMKKK